MPTILIKPWPGFTGYNAYSGELARDLRVLDQFLKDLRAAVGKGVGESQIANTTVTNVVTSTEVAAGVDLDGGGPLTSNITIDHADSAVTPGSYTYASVTVNARGHVTAASDGAPPSVGAGTTDRVAKWTASTTLGDSLIEDDGTNVSINDSSSGFKATFDTLALSADRVFAFPNYTGTFWVDNSTSRLTAVDTPLLTWDPGADGGGIRIRSNTKYFYLSLVESTGEVTLGNSSGTGRWAIPATGYTGPLLTVNGHTDTTSGDIRIQTAGKGLNIKEGSNARMGTATLSGGTATVATSAVTNNSRICLTIQSLGTVAVPKAIGVTARTAATNFIITSADATDTSVIAWVIMEPA